MSNMASTASPATGEEPPMYLQRPSSARSQDVSHVLSHTFRQLFSRDAIAPDTVKYLNTSKGGDDNYHEMYVEALHKVQSEREKRMSQAAMLERHIMQAQARAMSADERILNQCPAPQGFPDLGLPPLNARSHFRSCIDTHLLKSHNLIIPDDFTSEEIPVVPPPSAPSVPLYARETRSSISKLRDDQASDKVSGTQSMPVISHFENSDSDHTPLYRTPEPVKQKELQPVKKKKSSIWKNQIDAETREKTRKDLDNLQMKVDYLKNPRYLPTEASVGTRSLTKVQRKKAKEIGIKPKPEPADAPKEPPVIFIASPQVVVFEDYSVGQVYEISLEFKNVTSVLRPIRVIPPRTEYFAVGLGQFPGEHGLVAPGMSCRFVVQFSPDSLGDYDDYLMVHTQSDIPMVIKLQGRRPPPVLSLPDTLDVGQCLVGGVKVAQFTVKNTGGPGRFCMMDRKHWPANNFKVVTQTGAVTVPPFEVRPPVFQLAENEQIVLEILFVPGAVEKYSHEVTMVCDNCHVKHYTITGEGGVASVQLSGVEGGVAEPMADELCDISAQHLIRFDNLNPYTYMQRCIAVRNNTNCDLPYNWVVVKPYIKAKDPYGQDFPSIPNERVQDVEAAFSIEPEKGVLQAGAIGEFNITFAPPEVQSYHSVLHLVLRDVPIPPTSAAPSESSSEDLVLPVPASASQEKAPSSGSLSSRSRPGSIRDERPKSVLPVKEPQVEDVTALEIETKGICEALSVLLQPYAIHIPGQILVETSTKRQFRMINSSMSAIIFQWQNVGTSHIICVEPPVGELGPQCEMDLDLTISGSKPGKIEHTLLCYVQHLEEPLTLHVQAEIKGAEVLIEQSNVDFGLVRLGEASQTKVSVQNTCRVPATWKIRESETHASGDNEFVFTPDTGELPPLQSQDVVVRFTPKTCRSLRTLFEVLVDDGNEGLAMLNDVNELLGNSPSERNCSVVSVCGEVQLPAVCLVSSELVMDEVYLDVPVSHNVLLYNQTLLETTFEWGKLQGNDAAMCSVSAEPAKGRIGPREKLNVQIHFTAHTTGPLTDLRLPCMVGGMDQPVCLSLQTEVQGLSVTYNTQTTKEDNAAELVVDFGPDVQMGEVRRQYVYIKNNSAITAPFSFAVEHFFHRPPTPPEKRVDGHMPNKEQRRTMLGKTPNLADPNARTASKAASELSKAMLSEGKGAAFAVSPDAGILDPFAEQVVEVAAFSNMWGEYSDRLICKIEKLDLVYIPISLKVSGSPLLFQMVSAQPQQTPICRFGTHVSGINPITRQMRINNTAPCDIRLDWQTFNIDHSDKQLLDFVIAYGEDFPRKNPDGSEVEPPVPTDDSPEHTPRPPTGMIVDSPGSSTLMSPEPGEQPIDAEDEEAADDEKSEVDIAEGAEDGDRPPVMTVTMRPHGGQQAIRPYEINPSQVIIPAKSNACINVSFIPHPATEVFTEIECPGYALGYMSLAEKDREVEGKVVRSHGYSIEPLRLEMTANVKPALLTMECSDDEGMRYRAGTSDLLLDGQLVPECVKLRSATLSNRTQTVLEFRLISEEPFHLVEMDSTNKRPVRQLLQTDMVTLMPRQNVLVQVGFRVSMELLDYLDALQGNDENKPSPREGIELEQFELERKLHFKNNLVVEFNNKNAQVLPLHATLVIPALVLSRDVVDFGTCLVGQRREINITLSNPTASASAFSITQENKSDTCTDKTFEIFPANGVLEAQINHISRNKCILQVYFTAKHAENYESTFIIHGLLGERPCQLLVVGEGSYDGKYEAQVNV